MKKRRHQFQPSAAPSPYVAPMTTASSVTAAAPADVVVRDAGSEPVARRAAVPAIIFAVLAVFVFWGDMHIQGQGGDLDARVHYPFNSVKEIDALHVKPAEDPRIPLGASIYGRVGCAGCHQPDGNGGVAQNCPPLAGSDWVNVKDPERLIRLLLKGATGPITVNGKTWSGGSMLAFEDMLSDAEIAAVLSYIRNNWGNRNPLVEGAKVARVRAAIKDKKGYYSADELLQVPLKP